VGTLAGDKEGDGMENVTESLGGLIAFGRVLGGLKSEAEELYRHEILEGV
jgi:hypothetical protein